MSESTLAWECQCGAYNALSLKHCGSCGEVQPPAVAVRFKDIPSDTPLAKELVASDAYDSPFNITKWPFPVPEKDMVISLTYKGEPIAKGRALKGKYGNMYTPERTRLYENLLGEEFQRILAGAEPNKKDKFALRCIFYRSNRQRIDCDNLLKAVSDAATGLVWKDDSQVLEVIGRLFLNDPNPRVEIAIYRVEDTSPGLICPVCGKSFTTFPSIDSKHCSVACSNKSKRVALQCKECGGDYELPQSVARRNTGFCSRACSLRHHGRIRKANNSATWLCQDCGNPVSRKEYTRCRACSMIHRQDPNSNYWKLRHKKVS